MTKLKDPILIQVVLRIKNTWKRVFVLITEFWYLWNQRYQYTNDFHFQTIIFWLPFMYMKKYRFAFLLLLIYVYIFLTISFSSWDWLFFFFFFHEWMLETYSRNLIIYLEIASPTPYSFVVDLHSIIESSLCTLYNNANQSKFSYLLFSF